MSKAIRNLLILAAALVVAGAVLAGIGYGLGGMKPTRLTENGFAVIDRPFGSHVVVDEQWKTLSNIDIDADLFELSLEEGDTFSLKGVYDANLMEISISESNGTLTIRGNARNKWWRDLDFSVLDNDVAKMVLTYPKGTKFKDISVDSNLGSLRAEQLKAENLTVSLDLGNFTGRGITVGILAASMALGNCELEELSVATEAEIHLSSGNLSLKRSTIANLSSTNNLGTFDFSGILNGYADIDMDLGSLTMTIDVPKNDIAYSIDSDLGSNTFNGRSLGLSARQNVDSPKLTLDISTNLGSVDIRTD